MWTPKFQPYKDALELIADIPMVDHIRNVQMLPDRIRLKLAEGPLPRRYKCGVCEAFGGDAYTNSLKPPYDIFSTIWRAWAFHEVPKVKCTCADDLYYGNFANEIYNRCIITYKAAGWNGRAQKANA